MEEWEKSSSPILPFGKGGEVGLPPFVLLCDLCGLCGSFFLRYASKEKKSTPVRRGTWPASD
jgi:hypothetical protein